MNRVKSPAIAGVIGASVAAVVGATHPAAAADAPTAPYTTTAVSSEQAVSTSTTTLAVAVPEQSGEATLTPSICVI